MELLGALERLGHEGVALDAAAIIAVVVSSTTWPSSMTMPSCVPSAN